MSTGGLDSMPLSFLNSMCRPGGWGWGGHTVSWGDELRSGEDIPQRGTHGEGLALPASLGTGKLSGRDPRPKKK